MEITSKTNQKVKQWMRYHQKKYRDADQRFLIEGEHLIEEAAEHAFIECIMVRKGYPHTFHSYPCYECSDEVMDKLSMSVSKADIMACVTYIQKPDQWGKRLILLDQVQDPGNVGTIIRTACSFGFDGVILSDHAVDLYNEKLIRSTQGALFHIPVWRQSLSEAVKTCQRLQIPVYATSLHQADKLSDIKKVSSCVLIFGNEGSGVSQELLDLSDQTIIIEMAAFESLNVAVAAGICMYHFRKD